VHDTEEGRFARPEVASEMGDNLVEQRRGQKFYRGLLDLLPVLLHKRGDSFSVRDAGLAVVRLALL
jgi:hypothetical protein